MGIKIEENELPVFMIELPQLPLSSQSYFIFTPPTAPPPTPLSFGIILKYIGVISFPQQIFQ